MGLGVPLQMSCTVPFGVLRNRYSVRWYKGLTEIIDSDIQHISFGDDGALVFSEVKADDASRGYYCVVDVNRTDNVVSRQGSTVELNVLGKH